MKPLSGLVKPGAKYLNFNYTEFAETLYGAKGVCYIHGSRKNRKAKLILGHSYKKYVPDVSVKMPRFKDGFKRGMVNATFDDEKPVILLIDEYDVPVAKANNNGYYDEMLDVMKGLMQALKDNQALRFAVVTGCLKIAKESIFTGTNNFVSDTITNSRLNEYFGFVQSEVDQLLKDADLKEQAENIKKWYDGYHFGDFDVYCPWDVMNYMLELQRDPKAKPISYWKNTSDNAIIRSFIDYRQYLYFLC